MMHVAIEQCKRANVMVFAPTSPSNTVFSVDLLPDIGQFSRCGGFDIDGAAFRDTRDLRQMDFLVLVKKPFFF